MRLKCSVLAATVGVLMFGTSLAVAQPQTKLTGNLSSDTVNAVWCSALFLEESYYWEEESEEAIHYEDMAYDLGFTLDGIMEEAGLPSSESEEIWTVFDNAAAEYSISDEEGFLAELDHCEAAYLDKKLKLR